MKRLSLAVLLFAAAPAYAQPSPSPQSVPVPAKLAARIDMYLVNGGTHSEASGLSDELRSAFEAARRAAQPAAPPASADPSK